MLIGRAGVVNEFHIFVVVICLCSFSVFSLKSNVCCHRSKLYMKRKDLK